MIVAWSNDSSVTAHHSNLSNRSQYYCWGTLQFFFKASLLTIAMIIQTAPDYFNRSYGNKDDSDRHKKKQNIKNLVHFTLFYLKCHHYLFFRYNASRDCTSTSGLFWSNNPVSAWLFIFVGATFFYYKSRLQCYQDGIPYFCCLKI